MAAWNEAHRSATSRSLSGAMRSASMRTAVFRPENEKSGLSRPSMGRGNGKRPGSPRLRLALHFRAARIGQAQHLGHLVEGLAHRVVDRRADALIVADAAHGDELRVAARHEQQQIGERHVLGETGRQGVRLQVIDGDERLAG